MNLLKWLDQRKHWWKIFVIIFTVSIAVVGYIGYKTYEYAPPVADFVGEDGKVAFTAEDVAKGQIVFLQKGLMEYGSYLGDGGMRGPDFTGEALNLTAKWMNEFYDKDWVAKIPEEARRSAVVRTIVQEELKKNTYNSDYYGAKQRKTEFQPGAVILTAGQMHAFTKMEQYYGEMFGEGGDLVGIEAYTSPKNYITDKVKIHQLTAFFYWGGWICAAERPLPDASGFYDYSYTHNWPYDPLAGNEPKGHLVMWSIIGILVVIFSIGLLFYFYGKSEKNDMEEKHNTRLAPFATTDVVAKFKPTPSQRATYKFFAVAAILFLVQIIGGLLTLADFLKIFDKMGIEINHLLPVTVVRGWHSQISVLWISVCWFAATIWVLPLICRPEPKGQLKTINALFWMLVVVGVGGALGMPFGVSGMMSEANTYWFGIQGWEFLTIGRFFHHLLFISFITWLVIVMRGLMPALKQKQTWSLPNWMVYSIAGIILMFCASFVADKDTTNFVIADFWRWCTIHMWVEAFFEVFTTIIVAYFMYLMGFVSHRVAARVVYLAALLFLGSGLVGISHNFYWNAKSIETVALGATLSSLQVAPLILLTFSAWNFRKMPESTLFKLKEKGVNATFGLSTAFLFLIGVNFWNFFGAGVFGFSINLPIVNYYQHGTYLTVNHGHAALFGVYGNLAVATMLFCAHWNIGSEHWNEKLMKICFWSLNGGLMLMVVLDLFPAGVHQLTTVMNDGYAAARSQAYIGGDHFQWYTMMRGIGVAVFVFGGVLPLVWFMVTRWFRLKPAQTSEEQFVVPKSVLAMTGPLSESAGGGIAMEEKKEENE